MNDQYLKYIENKIDNKNTWKWRQNRHLKETEGLILAAQEQELEMNTMKVKIQKTKDETVDLMISLQ